MSPITRALVVVLFALSAAGFAFVIYLLLSLAGLYGTPSWAQ